MSDPRRSARQKEWGSGRVAFLAQVDELREAIDRGYPLKKLHRERFESLGGMTYSWFCRNVRKYIGRRWDETQGPGRRGGTGGGARAASTSAATRDTAAPGGASCSGGVDPIRRRWTPPIRSDPVAVSEHPELAPEDEAAAFRSTTRKGA
jgi:uncharacterized protein DUF5338